MGMLWRLIFRNQPPWYRWMERQLEPYDLFVRIGLLVIIAVSAVLLLVPSRSTRLLWFIYVVSP